MVVEKKALVEAFSEITGLSVLRGSKYANSTSKKLPAISVDYGTIDLAPLTEDGKRLASNDLFALVLYVGQRKDEEEQEDLFDEWFDKVLTKMAQKFPGFTLVAEKVGDANYNGTTAYAAAMMVSIGQKDYVFE